MASSSCRVKLTMTIITAHNRQCAFLPNLRTQIRGIYRTQNHNISNDGTVYSDLLGNYKNFCIFRKLA